VRPLHLRILREIAETEAEYGFLHLRLEGGTALAAYHLGHRQSEDLDLFGSPSMDARDFGAAVAQRLENGGLLVQSVGPASQGFARFSVVDPSDSPFTPVLLDLGRGSPFRLAPAEPTREGIRVASFRDLCAGKMHAICDRFEPRDFIDLHTILQQGLSRSVPADEERAIQRANTLIRDVMEVDPGLNPALIGQALERGATGRIVAEFPLRLLRPVTEQEVRSSIDLCIGECVRLVKGATDL
jgi:hypothetical protein